MSNRLRTLMLLPLLLLLLYVSWYVHSYDQEEKSDAPLGPAIETTPFTLIRYYNGGVADGYAQFYLDGTHMVHYGDERGSIIDNPDLLQLEYQAEGVLLKSYLAIAKTAHISEDKALITLNQDVELYQYDEVGVEQASLFTDQLFVKDRGESLYTDHFVEILSDRTRLTGYGLIGYPNQGEYTILNDVKTHYE